MNGEQLPTEVSSLSAARSRVRYWKARVGATAMGWTSALGPRGEHGFGVINYHRVHPQTGLPISVTSSALKRQIAGLLARGFEAWTVADYCDAIEQGHTVPRKAFAISFDDGFDNLRTHALPILAELGVPATVYLATGFVGDESFPFDPLMYSGQKQEATADAVRPLDLGGCRELFDAGWALGVHTHHHRDYVGQPDAFVDDMTASVAWLRNHFGVERPTFSFPYGGNDERLREACRRLPIRCGLTTESRVIVPGEDPFAWGRFGADEYDTGATLAAKLGGWYSAARQCWRRIAYGEKPARVLQSTSFSTAGGTS